MENRAAAGNEKIEKAIAALTKEKSRDNLIAVLEAIRLGINEEVSLLIPVGTPQTAACGTDRQDTQDNNKVLTAEKPDFGVRKLQLDDGQEALPAFTSQEEAAKGQASDLMLQSLAIFLEAAMAAEQMAGVIINPWGESVFLPKNLIQAVLEANKPQKPNNHIYFDLGDITTLECDCLVNAANSSLLGGGGVDGAIHRAAGPELLAECQTLNGCAVGEAKITKGYQLKAKYVIHTVGPVYSGKERDKELLINCYWNSLDLARQHNLHSIAFPAISTGAYGYPLQEAVPIALLTVLKWLEVNADYGMAVIMSCYNQQTFDMFQAFADEYKSGAVTDNLH